MYRIEREKKKVNFKEKSYRENLVIPCERREMLYGLIPQSQEGHFPRLNGVLHSGKPFRYLDGNFISFSMTLVQIWTK